MIGFAQQVERLQQRRAFAGRMHARLDILENRRPSPAGLDAMKAQLEPGLDFDPEGQVHHISLPHGLRSVRYSLSPWIQNAIDSNGRVDGHLVRRMPETLDETVAFIAADCPVHEQHWSELSRLIYFDPESYASILFPLKQTAEPIFRLILSREYRLAGSRYPALNEPLPQVGFAGRLIDLCVTFGEMERCDSLATGLASRDVSVKAVMKVLSDQAIFLDAIKQHTPEGEYLLGLLANPAMLPSKATSSQPWYGPWAYPELLAYDPLIDFADPRRFESFADDVRRMPVFANYLSGGRVLGSQANYWGVDLPQLAQITFLAAGDLIQHKRGKALDDGHPQEHEFGRQVAIRVLADQFLARHDPKFAIKLAEQQAALQAAAQSTDPAMTAAANPTVGRSRIQQNHDRAALMAPEPGMPGHSAAINGMNWLDPRAGIELWRAIISPPPARQWLEMRGIEAPARRVFEKLRSVRRLVPQLFHNVRLSDARLLADLATTVGWLSGQPQFTAILRDLVDHAGDLRRLGRLRARSQRGGPIDAEQRKATRFNRMPHPTETITPPK